VDFSRACAQSRYARAMFLGFNGWFVIVLFYVVVIAVLGAALYFVVRLAVLHAMKSHTRWVEQSQADPS